jgi:hypothetical protein
MSRSDDAQALIRVERGQASAEELAALTVVLVALSEGDPEPEPGRPFVGSYWWQGAGTYKSPDGWQ